MIVFRSAILVITGPTAVNISSNVSQFIPNSVLHSKFFHQFLYSAFVAPCDPFPCPSSLPPTLSRFIFRWFLQQINYQKTSCRSLSSRKTHTFTSLSYVTPFSVHSFTRKEPGTRCSHDFANATAGELSSTVTNFFRRWTMHVNDSWW